MENDYFDKIFKAKLEAAPAFEPTEADLRDMRAKLRASKPGQRIVFPWWHWLALLLAFLFLSALLSWFFFSRMDQMEGTIEELRQENQLLTQQEQRVEERIIQRIDTIYTTIYRTRYVPVFSGSTLSFSSMGHPGTFTPNRSHFTNSLIGEPGDLLAGYYAARQLPPASDTKRNSDQPARLLSIKDNTGLSSERSWIAPLSLLSRSTVVLEYPHLFKGYALIAPLIPRKPIREPLFRVQGFGLTLSGSPLILPNHDYGGTAYGLGGGLSLRFAGNRSLDIGAEWQSMAFEVKDEESLRNFPFAQPDDPDDTIHEVKAGISYLQMPLTLRQDFFWSRRLQPGIGLGIVAYRPLSQQITYEFYADQGQEYERTLILTDSQFRIDNLRLLLGLNIELARGFYLRPEFLYQYSWSNPDQQLFPLTYTALRLQAKYDF